VSLTIENSLLLTDDSVIWGASLYHVHHLISAIVFPSYLQPYRKHTQSHTRTKMEAPSKQPPKISLWFSSLMYQKRDVSNNIVLIIVTGWENTFIIPIVSHRINLDIALLLCDGLIMV
jgi:hypothetical protein